MSDAANTNDLTQLEDHYEILGELRRGPAERVYQAKRREDGAAVEITVLSAAANDERGALGHYASDVTVLANRSHPSMVPVRESRWIAADRYAVIRERVDGVTLAELLSRNERLTNPRIATILSAVLGALEWARSNGVVHRAVTPATVWLERGTDRPVVTFALTPISIHGIADAADDARTIGALGAAMLTHDPAAIDASALTNTQPPLATRVIAETAAMLACNTGDPAPDISAYIATVAMGDALRTGEIDMAVLEAELTETHRAIREQWEMERAAAERKAAEDAERCASEQAAIQKQMAEQQAQLDADRLVVDQRRAEVEQELVALADARALAEQRVADLEAERAAVDQLRTDVEQLLVEERQATDDLVAATKREGKSLPVPIGADVVVPQLVVPEPPLTGRRWRVPAMVGGAVLLLIMLLALARREGKSRLAAASIIVPESVRTRVGPLGPVPTQDPDYLTRSAAGSVAAPAPPREDTTRHEVARHEITRHDSAGHDSTVKRDTVVRRDTLNHSDRRR